jgi:SAM-dependent methyltransferase
MSDSLGAVKTLLGKLKRTPLHPQWFAFFRDERYLKARCAVLSGVVLDIGCADARPRQYLPGNADYIGIDYYSTATEWYDTRPDLFANAAALPLRDDSIDHALLLDVLEHLPQPERCLDEVHRTLKQGGTLTIQVPFLYPIHDAPLDFHRWTRHGLRLSASKHGFRIESESAIGHPVETATLNANIAMSKTVLNWIAGKNPLALTAIVLPFVILTLNCVAWIIAALSRPDDMMPYAYRMTLLRV